MDSKVQEWKKGEVEELRRLIEKNRTIALISLNNIRTSQIQELRRKFRDEVLFKCTKNNLIRIALKKSGKTKVNVEKLVDHLLGSNIFVFSNINPFNLSIMFQKNKVKLPARAGDVAISDVKVPEGNTAIAPGPIISEFTELGLPTKIEGGSIWINNDTVVVRKGEVISGRLASILSRLGIKPMEGGIFFRAAYEDGVTFSEEALKVDLEATKRELDEAAAYAYNLAVNAMYPTLETISAILNKAVAEARGLTLKAKIIDKDTLPLLMNAAYGEGISLSGKLPDLGTPIS